MEEQEEKKRQGMVLQHKLTTYFDAPIPHTLIGEFQGVTVEDADRLDPGTIFDDSAQRLAMHKLDLNATTGTGFDDSHRYNSRNESMDSSFSSYL